MRYGSYIYLQMQGIPFCYFPEWRQIMNRRIKPILASALTIAGLSVAGFALADSGNKGDDAEHRAFLTSKVSVADAAVAAEGETGARAMSVEFTKEDGAFVYEVELLDKDGTELEVLVDPNTGAVKVVEDGERDDAHDND